jgi:hypothetical protein
MVVLPSWFLPGRLWWRSPRGFSLAFRGGTPFVVSLWTSVVVLLLWFLPDPPWWYYLSGPLCDLWLAVPRTGWLFLVVPMVFPYGPSLTLLRSVSLAVPRSPSSWYLPPLSHVPTFYLPLTFSVVLPCCPVMLHKNYNSIVFEMSAKVQNF